jgi:ATP-dependent DNA helicase RecQ
VERLAAARTRSVFVSSFDRPNIRYTIVEKNDASHAAAALHPTRTQRRMGQDSGIVYCQSRRRVEEVVSCCCRRGH